MHYSKLSISILFQTNPEFFPLSSQNSETQIQQLLGKHEIIVILHFLPAQSAGAVEYANYISAGEGVRLSQRTSCIWW